MHVEILPTIGWTLIVLSFAAFSKARRIDRELRALIPRLTEDRWRQDLIRDIYRYRPEFAQFEALDAQFIPIRWRRSYHGARGIALVERMFFVCATGAILLVAGISLL